MPLPVSENKGRNHNKKPDLTREEIEALLAKVRAKKARESSSFRKNDEALENSNPKANDSEVSDEEYDDSEYGYDPKTKLKYKKFHRAPKEALQANKDNGRGGLTLEQLMRYTEEEEGFDLDDLNSSAQLFLPHLRVAPSREEVLQMRKDREARLKRDYQRKQSEDASKVHQEELEN